MSAPYAVIDTETTGLDPVLDDIWEFAGIRVEPSGVETHLHLFIDHDEARCALLPRPFLTDHRRRWPDLFSTVVPVSRAHAAGAITSFLRGPAGSDKVHIVGAVPNFDTERLSRLLADHNHRWPAHYHLIDVENLIVGYLRGRMYEHDSHVVPWEWKEDEHALPVVDLNPPWDSEELSHLIGIDVIPGERHTAMGDVKWAKRIYERVMGLEGR